MKSVYRLGDDLFIPAAFVAFVLGIGLKLLGVPSLKLGIAILTIRGLFLASALCLLFSIALSLYDSTVNKR